MPLFQDDRLDVTPPAKTVYGRSSPLTATRRLVNSTANVPMKARRPSIPLVARLFTNTDW